VAEEEETAAVIVMGCPRIEAVGCSATVVVVGPAAWRLAKQPDIRRAAQKEACREIM
jgi:hypothetical protein